VIRVLLVEDDQTIRIGLGGLLIREPGIAVAGKVAFDGDVAACAARVYPHVVLVNTDYMVSQILPVVGDLKARYPACSVLILSDPTKPGMLPPRRRAHGVSFLVKGSPIPVLADAIRRVARGERIVDPRLQVAAMTTEKEVSTREWEVLALAAQGDTVADIARRLYLSLGTVRNHLSSVITKTGARNRLDAIRIGRKGGWLR
jgi:two-component system, NarL family, response regulator DesR